MDKLNEWDVGDQIAALLHHIENTFDDEHFHAFLREESGGVTVSGDAEDGFWQVVSLAGWDEAKQIDVLESYVGKNNR